MLKGFRDFILRGNVVDLAVAVMIGAAFNSIVASFTKDIVGQLIAALAGKPDFGNLDIHLRGTPIHYGNFLNATISFVITASIVYFLIVLPLNYLLSKIKGPEAASTKPCPQCLSDVPLTATRCKFCTQPI
ncbi:large conductance mechanosensitive channel protein MscL [Granulicella sp. dw_53]|uniref:large conductance mechanosensitive channel protein MscL n=1 Tax=Granulicella sp. dw_53 TaxID=2719792 RepID=UPI001BD3BC72|nr:large conductance mechanosensitive channel protein MscL [Granulicella sp. dw_53]